MTEVDDRSFDGTEELLSLSRDRGVVPRSHIVEGEPRADTLVGYKRVRVGELVMNKMQAWNGMFGLSSYEGLVSPDYAVFAIDADRANSRFIVYALRSRFYASQFLWRSRGMGTAFLRLHPEKLLDTPLPSPPLGVQTAIAHFLDAETARIDALIVKKQRLIELFDERTSRWLSQRLIPRDAAYTRLARFASVQTGLTVDGSRSVDDTAVSRPYLRVANVLPGRLELETVTEITVTEALAVRTTLRFGDVLMTEGGDLDKLGRGTVWRDEIPGCLHQNHVFAVRTDPEGLDPEYLALLTQTAHGRAYFERTGSRVTNLASTSTTKVLDFPVPVVPIAEQRALVAAASRVLEHRALLIDRLDQQVRLLREHRQALITAAVTGQLDVSKATA